MPKGDIPEPPGGALDMVRLGKYKELSYCNEM